MFSVYPPGINSVRDFGQLYTSVMNIWNANKWKMALSTTIPSTFSGKNRVKFGPLTEKLKRLIFAYSKINTALSDG